MEWYEPEVQALERARAAQPLPQDVVAFYGGSSIRLWETLTADFPTINVINLGFGGSTLAACVWFFERLVVPYQPRAIVFYAGDNDLGDGQQPAEVIHSFCTLLDKIDTHLGPTPFAFISIKPSLARWNLIDKIRQTNEMIQHELAMRQRGYYIDIFPYMLGGDGQPRPDLFAEDGLHLSPAGYYIWKKVVSEHQGHFL